MDRLPEVVAAGKPLSLPLCPATTRRVAAALIADDASTPNRDLLADALARDPSLTIWAIASAHQLGADDLGTIDELAGWLQAAALDLWSSPAGSDVAAESLADDIPRGQACEPFASLAARSIDVAARSAHIARQRQIDEAAAFLLGLLHLTPQWIAAANGGFKPPPPQMLPPWLCHALDTIDRGPPGQFASASDCVRAALEMAEAGDQPSGEPPEFEFDRRTSQARIADARADWACDGSVDLLAPLAAKLRRLRDLEQQFARTLEAAKLESLKELAYGAGHEINNPLANISARAQSLLPDERDPERRRMLAAINSQAFRAHEMIADMMLFARPPVAKKEPVDLVELVRKLHAELSPQAAGQQTQLVLEVPQVPVTVLADKTQIAVALHSLCINGLEALVTGGRLKIALPKPANGSAARILVVDNGPGIPAEMRPHVFDPFFSGREAGRGLGLGLSKCWRIVTMHGGRVDVESHEGQGAVFTITLPGSNGR